MRVILDQGPGGARVLALGTFDGVHLGHQALLKAGKEYARTHGIQLRVCSFDRHPLEVLRPEIAPAQLTTAAEKERLMASFGVDELQLLHFTREMADMPPEDFLKMLRESVCEMLLLSTSTRLAPLPSALKFSLTRSKMTMVALME